MKEHVLGYILLLLGICIMTYSALQVYYLFTNKAEPFDVFEPPVKTQQQEISKEQLMADPSLLAKMQTEAITSVMQTQMGKSLNLGSTIFFYFFLMTFGYRFSLLGTQLVRPIKVALKAKNIEVDHKES